jgi:phosphoenolpyruvate synthase/pyruvate phosphate dikinase
MASFVLSLSDTRATLENVGGKGMSLARLARAGLPVPDGFHITTNAYRQFVDANELQPKILAAVGNLDAAQPAQCDAASASIAGLFATASIPEDLVAEIGAAYRNLCGGPAQTLKAVAVRSSATAEDLPDASFAGQQETYLNIRGIDAVLEAVRKCWASLWTARAIAYRGRQGIAPDSVALAVVVQELVAAEASGVMFTANPINGKRDEMMITAAWGLGEAIVSGSVTPDTVIVDKSSRGVAFRETADKLRMTVRNGSGTRDQPVPPSKRKKPVLNNAQTASLAALGLDIEGLYSMPMDIEWTLEGGKFGIVQARPITALPPASAQTEEQNLQWPIPHPKAVLARGSFAEFVPEPVSPLFATLAVPIARKETIELMGGIGVTGQDAYLFTVINDYVYVGFIFTPRMTWVFLRATLGLAGSLFKTAEARAKAAREKCEAAVRKWRERGVGEYSAAELLQGASDIFRTTAEYYTVAQSGTIPVAMLSEQTFTRFYNLLVKRKDDPDASKFVFGTENLALQAEKALFDLATWAKTQPELAAYLAGSPATDIVDALATDARLSEFSTQFDAYLSQHGHAIYDLDFSKPVPAENPAPLLETLKVYLRGENNPYARQQAAVALREQAATAISKRLDPLRRKYFMKLLKWAQDTAPLRENSIAEMGLGYPQLRRLLSELGWRLEHRGAIACRADIYWLELLEVQSLAAKLDHGETLESYAEAIKQRKEKWQAMRRVSPPSTLPKKSWMRAFFPDNEGVGPIIKGFGASAGRATARACVMLGPEDFNKMQSGDAIVAGITTPAWTPLFARASAIVTDIGGPLSHSSIVAREYGIPAVLATGIGTRRIRDGQTITVDGSAGKVTLALS